MRNQSNAAGRSADQQQHNPNTPLPSASKSSSSATQPSICFMLYRGSKFAPHIAFEFILLLLVHSLSAAQARPCPLSATIAGRLWQEPVRVSPCQLNIAASQAPDRSECAATETVALNRTSLSSSTLDRPGPDRLQGIAHCALPTRIQPETGALYRQRVRQ